MNEKEFNLLHEPWILVMRPDGMTEEVSLLDVFRRAPEFQSLAGELPTQDVAVLRLLLAILHAVFGHMTPTGHMPPYVPMPTRRRHPAMRRTDGKPCGTEALSRWES